MRHRAGGCRRIGGITPWLKVAHAAEALDIAICSHFLMELHVSLCAAVPEFRVSRIHSATRRSHAFARADGSGTAMLMRRWNRDLASSGTGRRFESAAAYI
ncbi:mandelate racemase/muconate lactonizing enzyme family protein [Candidatus Paraburkholderia calva]|nr:mandelate racemase/muconate lactonizing enzyme family protein [Candidatus Paraburkholderia calva]